MISSVLPKFSEILAKGQKPLIIADEAVWNLFPQLSAGVFRDVPVLLLKSSEAIKSLDGYAHVLAFLANLKLDRSACVLALGGGCIGDLAGFAASTYRRGIPYITIPTTLLAMVDSAYGGKVGINLPQGKNLVGSFQLPQDVWVEFAFLETLPTREWNSGMAELIKASLIGDSALFSKIEQLKKELSPKSSEFAVLLQQAIAVKKHLVEIDFFETSSDPVDTRRLLNLGHTFGHAIEQASGFSQYTHGEAVSLGICLAARLSKQIGWLSEADLARIEGLLSRYQLPTKLITALPVSALMDAMFQDKKVQNGHLNLIVLAQIGSAKVIQWDDLKAIHALWLDIGATGG